VLVLELLVLLVLVLQLVLPLLPPLQPLPYVSECRSALYFEVSAPICWNGTSTSKL
jgi:hypothetical protein